MAEVSRAIARVQEEADKKAHRWREALRRRLAKMRRHEKEKVAAIRRSHELVTRDCAEFIAGWEGFVDHPYKPVAAERFFTWGYGHYGADVPSSGHVTRDQALVLLQADAGTAARAVDAGVRVPLNRNQWAALTSWVFNCGAGVVADSTLVDLLNQGHYDRVPSELMKWVNGASGPLQGLVNRRRAECALWRKKP